MLPSRIRSLVSLLSRLPGIGEKTALRLALYLTTEGRSLSADLGRELSGLMEGITQCERCGNLAERVTQGTALCEICSNPRRDQSILCVVAKVQDLLALERSGVMRGLYFVLGRLLSPLDGTGPDRLPLDALLARIRTGSVREVILATPPSVEGEATALYLAQQVAQTGVEVTRIASGIPHGGDLEFSDQITLGRAIVGRRKVNDVD